MTNFSYGNPYRISLHGFEHREIHDARDHINRNGGGVLYKDDELIGVVLSRRYGLAIIGEDPFAKNETISISGLIAAIRGSSRADNQSTKWNSCI